MDDLVFFNTEDAASGLGARLPPTKKNFLVITPKKKRSSLAPSVTYTDVQIDGPLSVASPKALGTSTLLYSELFSLLLE